jgi:chemotaxis protein CheZ
MAVQRKVFRIEEHVRVGARRAIAAQQAAASPQLDTYLAEIKALRALLEPRAEPRRGVVESARAQLTEVQSYRDELAAIYAAIQSSRQDMDSLKAGLLHDSKLERASRELDAIVAGAQQATQDILRAAENVDETTSALSGTLRNAHQKGLAHDIRDHVGQIYEACNFHDLTGQRVANVLAAIQFVEQQIGRLAQAWQRIEQFKPMSHEDAGEDDRRFLNGPKLAGDAGHSSQDDVDAIFGCA